MPDFDKLATLSDTLPGERDTQVFQGLMRDVDGVLRLLQDASSTVTILSPSNAAMAKANLKPWEKAVDYQALGQCAYEGSDGQGRARGNLQKFVEAHIIPQTITSGEKVKTMAGSTVWMESDGSGQKTIQPWNIHVSRESDRASNGQLWVIDGILSPT